MYACVCVSVCLSPGIPDVSKRQVVQFNTTIKCTFALLNMQLLSVTVVVECTITVQW